MYIGLVREEKKMKQIKLDKIIKQHEKWLNGGEGKRANLSGANLTYLDLTGANLTQAILSGADLTHANLTGANLTHTALINTNLTGTDLTDACLWNCMGNNKEVKTFQLGKYMVVFYQDRLQIGCKNYSIEEWYNFTGEQIKEMDTGALNWWEQFNPIIASIMESLK